ncbi:MAG: pyridoxal phosphate-dependent aminotransferase [Treponema sp.]|jgi:cystathionine beta-lyase|nr:pyridoxal phosphate-dependent aminotransferase [Treponema sp.]
MKNYDFETIIPRYGKGSGKWDEMRQVNPSVEDGIIPFSVADMELKNAPEITEGLGRFLAENILGYAGATPDYYSAVCSWMKRRHNWDIRPEWIVENKGVVEGFFTSINAFTGGDEGVILMTPVYYPMTWGIVRNRRRMIENKLIYRSGRYEIDFEDLEAKARDPNTRMLLLCSPHNPVGRVWKAEELTRIGRICIDNNVLVVSDEIHFDLVMPGYRHTVFASLSEEFAGHSVIHTAPSKTFNLAGLQTSNTIIPNPDLRELYRREMMRHLTPRCNILGYEACRLAYEYGEDWLEQALALIDTNRKLVKDFLSREIPLIRVVDMEGTYLLWLDFNPLGIEYRELECIMRMEARLFFDEGHIFGEAGRGFERWNLACPTRSVQEGLDRLKSALNKSGTGGSV